jgi:para-aminobenzoate synthetase / 4-amino-4-deoxychorismate lyase
MTASPYVLLDDSLNPGGRSLLYVEPEEIIAPDRPEQVDAALDAVSAGLTRGLHAAGFFSYELGYCFEPKLARLLPGERRVPLFWVGLFRAPRPLDDPGTRVWLDAHGGSDRATISDLKLSWSRAQYAKAFASVQDYIAAGDVYQINLTLKYRFAFEGDPVAASTCRRAR